MPNVTLKVDAETLSEVKKVASERGTSVNALVRAYLQSLVEEERAAYRAEDRRKRAELLERMDQADIILAEQPSRARSYGHRS